MVRPVLPRWLVLVGVLVVSLLDQVQPAAATTWSVALMTGSGGEAASMATTPPTGVTAACPSSTGQTIKVSWTASAHATSYTIYQAKSTTATPGTYSSAQSGVTGTSWTTATLTAGYNYWYEAATVYGSNWTSAKSTATAETTISSTSPECKQP